jgi:hydrogenase maturation protein HypF
LTTIRRRLRCIGAVQGVGFRPTAHRLATELGLAGRVWNDPGGATVEVEGPASAVDAFSDLLPRELPRLARLDDLQIAEIPPVGDAAFEVSVSDQGSPAGALVPPDASLCPACRADMADPGNRRHAYAFTTCTDCGPRYSLALELPYDRARTTMACFPLCEDCQREYEDTADRRFHAEPVCCPACGPRLWLVDVHGTTVAEGPEAVDAAVQSVLNGHIVAVKGLGGFQLACLADDDAAVARLRRRKHRPTKPFAVMVADRTQALALADLTDADLQFMESPRAPIVLGRRRRDAPVAHGLAPGLDDLGLLLPTTPLHELVMAGVGRPLVATSGNASDEPICRGNREARDRLGAIADALLLHDRDVARRVDDSVMRSTGDGPILIRRARGWVPEPVALPLETPAPILAVGGHLQVTAAVADGGNAQATPHIGDLDSEACRSALAEAIIHLEDLLQIRPEVIAADLHPDYPSAWLAQRLAEDRGGRVLQVQHHLAHAGALCLEHGFAPPRDGALLVLAFDGTGWGTDGTAWGGEWLLVDEDLTWRRVARLEPLPLVGGEAAVREPWRLVASALATSGAQDLLSRIPLCRHVDADRLNTVAQLASTGTWPRSSGAGRLFEALGALLGVAAENGFEGEAAMRAEAAAAAGTARPWRVELSSEADQIPSRALLVHAAARLADGASAPDVAASFHTTFCRLAAELTQRMIHRHRPAALASGGGCLVNRLLRAGLASALEDRPLLPTRLPPGDGALSLGQATMVAMTLSHDLSPDRLEFPTEDPFAP